MVPKPPCEPRSLCSWQFPTRVLSSGAGRFLFVKKINVTR